MTTLIFDKEISGHHVEYISHLVSYITEEKINCDFIFVVHYEFSSKFTEITRYINAAKNIRIVEITEDEYNWAKKGNIMSRSIRAYKLMNKYALKYHAQKVILMYFNTFQLALGIYQPNYEVSGILFLQFYRMERNNLKEKIKYLRKYLQTWFYVHNKNIKHVFVLNDIKTVQYLNREFKTEIFKMLPDPIPHFKPIHGFSIKDFFNISQKRKIFLHPGSLSKRKGTIEILDAFYHLSDNAIKRITVILIGKADTATDAIIKNKISKIEKVYSNAQIIYRNEFISNSMLKSCLDQCDVVLLPYKNAEASSGILGQAIAAGKCVIGTNKGLLGYLIKTNKAGFLIDEATAYELAKKMEIAITNHFSNKTSTQFIKSHSPRFFAKSLLE